MTLEEWRAVNKSIYRQGSKAYVLIDGKRHEIEPLYLTILQDRITRLLNGMAIETGSQAED